MKHTPGPYPSSCLTCRRRRKKCDKTRPTCERCRDGGLQCQGYDYVTAVGESPNPVPTSSYLNTFPRVVSGFGNSGGSHGSVDSEPVQTGEPSWSAGSWVGPSTSVIKLRGIHNSRELHNGGQSGAPSPSPPQDIGCSIPTKRSRSPPDDTPEPPAMRVQYSDSDIVPDASPRSTSSYSDALSPRPSSVSSLSSSSSVLFGPLRLSPIQSPDIAFHSIPPRVYPDVNHAGWTIKFILSQYEPIIDLVLFKPTQINSALIREHLILRLRESTITRWSMYLGAKIFQCVLQDGDDADLKPYRTWLERFDQLCITSSNDSVIEDLAGRLSGALEISYLKYLASNISIAYTLLRAIAPTFMKLACADPTLWPRRTGSAGVSLAHTIVAKPFELCRFIFMDTISSLILGVPPLVEYDTSTPAIESDPTHPIEWVHGCPAALIIAILKISIWRSDGSRNMDTDRLKEIEADIWGWYPKCDYGKLETSWQLVARLAIQEGWRHAALIYLYMGMCDCSNDDPRVQKSVRQIIQLLGVTQPDSALSVHFFIPLLLAAICARGEKQRDYLRRGLAQCGENKAWIFKGRGFISVVEQLWHGPAADGAAITWGDYVHLRHKQLHLGV
ncbi:hypothetical protein BDV93DRAFT_520962 [Ceratobasidium sp. AG-I]|nr:hypothetical protein BDV93DRAFT_520962 [Ceratobasidium sp. AG-I]